MFYLFIWLHQVLGAAHRTFAVICGSFLAVYGLSPVATHGLQNMRASIVVAQGFNCSRARGILVLQPGMEPVSPALLIGFLTTRPPGKFRLHFINRLNSCSRYDLQEIPIDNVDSIWFTEGPYLRDEQRH